MNGRKGKKVTVEGVDGSSRSGGGSLTKEQRNGDARGKGGGDKRRSRRMRIYKDNDVKCF